MNRIVSLVLAAATLLLPAVSHAIVVRCVDTSAQLAQALAEVVGSSDPLHIIRLRSGIYSPTAQSGAFTVLPQHSNQTVELSGGWSGNNGACTSRTFDSSVTVLSGTGAMPALNMTVGLSLSSPLTPLAGVSVHVHGLTLTNNQFAPARELDMDAHNAGFHYDKFKNRSACLNAYVRGPGNQLKLERMDVRDCKAPSNGNASGDIVNTGASLLMNNIVVRGGIALGNGGMYVETINQGTSRLTQFTVVNNGHIASEIPYMSGLDLRAYRGGVVHLSNSVIWGNRQVGYVDPTDELLLLSARRNLYGASYEPDSAGAIHLKRVHVDLHRWLGPNGTLTTAQMGSGNPGLQSLNHPYLTLGSPLIDSGLDAPEGGIGVHDAAGKPRVQGSKVDVGAFEYAQASVGGAIFQDGFE